jgi:hypothetical protein
MFIVIEMVLLLEPSLDARKFTLSVKFENNIQNTVNEVLAGPPTIPLQHLGTSKFKHILNSFEPVAVVLEQVSKVHLDQWVSLTQSSD